MKFCKPIKPLELFTDEELTDAFCCGGQHQFAIEIFERWNKARAELAKANAIIDELRTAPQRSIDAEHGNAKT